MTLHPELGLELRRFVGSASPLVICDFDGVLAPIVDQPERAFPDPRSVDALIGLADVPGAHVAVVSGRSVDALETLASFPAAIHLVGSHGSEYRNDPAIALDSSQADLLERITGRLEQIAAAGPGLLVEAKPLSVAFHYRMADPELAEHAVSAVEQGPAGWAGVKVKTGKKVIELVVVDADKGTAVDRLRHRLGAGPVLFIGDDVTDEDAFRVLIDGDVGIKVGPGDTLARHRLGDTDDVAELLRELLESTRIP